MEDKELREILDTVSKYNKLGGRGHGDLEDNCYICGISPAKLKQAIEQNYIRGDLMIGWIEKELETCPPDEFLTDSGHARKNALTDFRRQIKSALGLEEEV